MKINFSAIIRDIEGAPMKEGDKDVTLGRVACNALLAAYVDEQNLSGEEKLRRFQLAKAVIGGGEQELKAEDVALVKKLIAKAYAALIVGRAYSIIEGEDG